MGGLGSRLSARPRSAGSFGSALGIAPFGDVFVRRHPAAAGNWNADRMGNSAIACLDQPADRLTPADAGDNRATDLVRVSHELGNLVTMPEQLHERAAGLHDLRRQTVHVDVAAIAEDDLALGVEHADALRDVLDRDFELPFPCRRSLASRRAAPWLALRSTAVARTHFHHRPNRFRNTESSAGFIPLQGLISAIRGGKLTKSEPVPESSPFRLAS